jgi:hypothetical protein
MCYAHGSAGAKDFVPPRLLKKGIEGPTDGIDIRCALSMIVLQ